MKTTRILITAMVLIAVISMGFPAQASPGTLSAGFMANVNTGTAPLTVHFTDTSEGGPTGWHWNFGDNSSSTLQHPVYTYTTPGTYTVTLTVEDGMQSDTMSADIVVTNPMVTTPTPAPTTVPVIIRPVPVPVKDPHHVQPPHEQPAKHPHKDQPAKKPTVKPTAKPTVKPTVKPPRK